MSGDIEIARQFHERLAKQAYRASDYRRLIVEAEDLDQLEEAWVLFLEAFSKFLNFAEKCAVNLEKTKWLGSFRNERRLNGSLTYALHARNAENHGISGGYEGRPGSLGVGGVTLVSGMGKGHFVFENCIIKTVSPSGELKKSDLNADFRWGNGRVAEGWVRSPAEISSKPPHLRLTSVIDRGQEYQLPSLKKSEESAAIEISQNCLNWMIKKRDELKKFILSD